MRPARRPVWLPTRDQELLLQAALSDGEDALAAWREWSEHRPIEQIEGVAYQVLPLAWINLSRLDPSDDLLGLIRGVRRHSWAQNHRLLEFGTRVIEDLQAAGIETVALKGLAIAPLYYPDVGARPMHDLDVLVRRDAAEEAIRVLRRELEPVERKPEDRVAVQHGVGFEDEAGYEVDLHWYSMWRASPDDDFWDAARPLDLGAVSTKALCPSDQLLHVCAHGAWWHRAPTVRWVIDSVMILRAEPELDWQRLVAQARKRQLTGTLAQAMDYLRATFAVPIPDQAIDALRQSRRSLTERLASHAASRPPTMLRSLRLQWEMYRRLRSLDPAPHRPSSFPEHLRTAWGYDSYGSFARYAVERAFGLRRGGRGAR